MEFEAHFIRETVGFEHELASDAGALLRNGAPKMIERMHRVPVQLGEDVKIIAEGLNQQTKCQSKAVNI